MEQKNTLGDLNDILFRQIGRLEDQAITEPDAMAAEIERAKTVQSLAGTVIQNGKLLLDVARLHDSIGDTVAVPAMLSDGR